MRIYEHEVNEIRGWKKAHCQSKENEIKYYNERESCSSPRMNLCIRITTHTFAEHMIRYMAESVLKWTWYALHCSQRGMLNNDNKIQSKQWQRGKKMNSKIKTTTESTKSESTEIDSSGA